MKQWIKQKDFSNSKIVKNKKVFLKHSYQGGPIYILHWLDSSWSVVLEFLELSDIVVYQTDVPRQLWCWPECDWLFLGEFSLPYIWNKIKYFWKSTKNIVQWLLLRSRICKGKSVWRKKRKLYCIIYRQR